MGLGSVIVITPHHNVVSGPPPQVQPRRLSEPGAEGKYIFYSYNFMSASHNTRHVDLASTLNCSRNL